MKYVLDVLDIPRHLNGKLLIHQTWIFKLLICTKSTQLDTAPLIPTTVQDRFSIKINNVNHTATACLKKKLKPLLTMPSLSMVARICSDPGVTV